jgi:hypothetical protein
VTDERDPLDDTLAEGLRALAPSEFSTPTGRSTISGRGCSGRARVAE